MVMDAVTRRITQESLERANKAIANDEIEGEEFEKVWNRLSEAYEGMEPPKTWKQIKRVTEAALDEGVPVYEDPADYS